MKNKQKKRYIDGAKLEYHREMRGLSQADLEDLTIKLGSGKKITEKTIWRYENGKTPGTLSVIRILAEALELEPHDLLLDGIVNSQKNDQESDISETPVEEFCNSLKEKALKRLDKKLYGEDRDDYKSPDLEIGHIVLEEPNQKSNTVPIDHNREWKSFNAKNISGLSNVTILSGETGSGKSTFLLNLQLDILEDKNSEIIPLYIEASQLTDYISNDNSEYFLNELSNLYVGYLKNEKVDVFLKKHSGKILFLIDGLDQSGKSGTGFKRFVEDLREVTGESLIISSRPFAASDLEKHSEIGFLRLMSFGPTIIEDYFSELYPKAVKLCHNCPEVLSTPMLAYMVRKLIRRSLHDNINNRKELYDRFIEHIFDEHVRNKFEITFHDEEAIIRILQELSYNAIDNEEFQRVAYSSVTKCLDHKTIFDDLLKFGITDMLGVEGKHLYFTHQSFQEYLVAVHVSNDDKLVKKLLKEKWNPKWKEVIKFLVSIKGQKIIELILREQDNVINSNLLLAAKLVQETEISIALKDKILQKLLNPPNYTEAQRFYCERAMVLVDKNKAIKRLLYHLSSEDFCTIYDGLNIFAGIDDLVKDSEEVIDAFIKLARSDDPAIFLRASYCLKDCNVKDSLICEIMVAKLDHPCVHTVNGVLTALSLLKIKDETVIKHIVIMFDSQTEDTALWAIGSLEHSTLIKTETIEKVIEKIYDDDEKIAEKASKTLDTAQIENELYNEIVAKMLDTPHKINHALKALRCRLSCKLSSDVINKLTAYLDHSCEEVILQTIDIFRIRDIFNKTISRKLNTKLGTPCKAIAKATIKMFASQNISDKAVLKRIVSKLDDSSTEIVTESLYAIECLKLDNKPIVRKVIAKLDDSVARQAIFTLKELNVESKDIVKKIADMLDNSDETAVDTALFAISWLGLHDRFLLDKIVKKLNDSCEDIVAKALLAIRFFEIQDEEIISKIVEKLDSSNRFVLKAAVITLESLKIRTEAILEKMSHMLDLSDFMLGFEILRAFRAWNIKNEIVIDKIISILDDPNLSSIASDTLRDLKFNISNDSIRKIITRPNISPAYYVLEDLYKCGRLEFLYK